MAAPFSQAQESAKRPKVLGVLLPVRASIDVAAPTSGAPESSAKLGDDHVIGIARHVNVGSMPAIRAVAGHVQPGHAMLTHVAQRHRLVGGSLRHPEIVLRIANCPQDEQVASGSWCSIAALDFCGRHGLWMGHED